MNFLYVLLFFTLAALADIVFVSFRCALSYKTSSLSTLYILMALHELFLVFELLAVATQLSQTCLITAGATREVFYLLKWFIPMFLIRVFLTAFTMLYKNILLPRWHDDGGVDGNTSPMYRPWGNAGYGVLVCFEFIFIVFYLLDVVRIFSFLTDKTLYTPYHRRRWRYLMMLEQQQQQLQTQAPADGGGLPDAAAASPSQPSGGGPPGSLLVTPSPWEAEARRSARAVSFAPTTVGDKKEKAGASRRASSSGAATEQSTTTSTTPTKSSHTTANDTQRPAEGPEAPHAEASTSLVGSIMPLHLKRRFTLNSGGEDGELNKLVAAMTERGYSPAEPQQLRGVEVPSPPPLNPSWSQVPVAADAAASTRPSKRHPSFKQLLSLLRPSASATAPPRGSGGGPAELGESRRHSSLDGPPGGGLNNTVIGAERGDSVNGRTVRFTIDRATGAVVEVGKEGPGSSVISDSRRGRREEALERSGSPHSRITFAPLSRKEPPPRQRGSSADSAVPAVHSLPSSKHGEEHKRGQQHGEEKEEGILTPFSGHWTSSSLPRLPPPPPAGAAFSTTRRELQGELVSTSTTPDVVVVPTRSSTGGSRDEGSDPHSRGSGLLPVREATKAYYAATTPPSSSSASTAATREESVEGKKNTRNRTSLSSSDTTASRYNPLNM